MVQLFNELCYFWMGMMNKIRGKKKLKAIASQERFFTSDKSKIIN